MTASASDVMHELVGFIRESAAIIHYFCDVVMVITQSLSTATPERLYSGFL